MKSGHVNLKLRCVPNSISRAISPVLPLALSLLVATCPASAGDLFKEFDQARQQGRTATQLTIDNDSLLLNRDDGFYTSGAEIGQVYRLAQKDATLLLGWHIGQSLYTNSDIKLRPDQFGPPDHPYAGWLFAGGFREQRKTDGSSVRYGIDVGCIGPCAGGYATQSHLHRLIDQPQPQGWSTQVKNEPGLILSGDFTPLTWRWSPSLELAPNFHGRFGNIFTDAGAGLTLRAGQLDAAAGWQAFARLDAVAVAYNATLQGGYFSSDYARAVKPKRLVGEAELGAAIDYGALGLRASVIRRGNEIDGLSNGIGMQNFVRLVFSYTP
jgi:hypothetical protein